MTDSTAPRRALRVPAACAKVGKGKSWLYDISNPKSPRFDPTFPKALHIGGNTLFLEHEIDRWIDLQAGKRDAAAPERVAKAKRAAAASVAARAAARPVVTSAPRRKGAGS